MALLVMASIGIGFPIAERHKLLFCINLCIKYCLLAFLLAEEILDVACQINVVGVWITITEIGRFVGGVEFMNEFKSI